MIDIRLYHGDMIEVLLREMADESVDLIVTSPPYNVAVDYGVEVDDSKSLEDYARFANMAMSQMARVLKKGGRLCLEVGGSSRNFPMSYLWQDSAYKNELGLFSEIGLQHRKTNPCAWGSYLKADAVWTIPNFHLLYVFYKDTDRKASDGDTRITKDEWMEWTRGYWKINWSTGNNKHPASFPVELPIRCMKLFGHGGDMILDPFAGSGSTGRACIAMGDVAFTGVEIVSKYFRQMERDLEFENAQMRLFDEDVLKATQITVPTCSDNGYKLKQLSIFEQSETGCLM